MHDGNDQDPPVARVRRRDRHGRGLRGLLAPPQAPLYRTRRERFEDLVLLAVSQLEPRWETELAGVEFAVEEIPLVPPGGARDEELEPVPLARLEPGSPDAGTPEQPARPARIVVYRRPLMVRAESDEELGELVLDVIVEEFARLLGLDPEIVDPGYPGED